MSWLKTCIKETETCVDKVKCTVMEMPLYSKGGERFGCIVLR